MQHIQYFNYISGLRWAQGCIQKLRENVNEALRTQLVLQLQPYATSNNNMWQTYDYHSGHVMKKAMRNS